MTPQGPSPTTQEVSLIQDKPWTFFAALSFFASGLKDVGITLTTSTPSKRFSPRLGWPPLRSAWLLGKPLNPNAPPRTQKRKLELN
jgi:hypothetical protein